LLIKEKSSHRASRLWLYNIRAQQSKLREKFSKSKVAFWIYFLRVSIIGVASWGLEKSVSIKNIVDKMA